MFFFGNKTHNQEQEQIDEYKQMRDTDRNIQKDRDEMEKNLIDVNKSMIGLIISISSLYIGYDATIAPNPNKISLIFFLVSIILCLYSYYLDRNYMRKQLRSYKELLSVFSTDNYRICTPVQFKEILMKKGEDIKRNHPHDENDQLDCKKEGIFILICFTFLGGLTAQMLEVFVK